MVVVDRDLENESCCGRLGINRFIVFACLFVCLVFSFFLCFGFGMKRRLNCGGNDEDVM